MGGFTTGDRAHGKPELPDALSEPSALDVSPKSSLPVIDIWWPVCSRWHNEYLRRSAVTTLAVAGITFTPYSTSLVI